MSIHVNFSVRSEIGHVRENNEDNFFCNGIFMSPSEREKPFFMNGTAEVPCVFAVFDGMGGHDLGELASLTAAETLSEHFGSVLKGSHEEIDSYVIDANRRLREIMRANNIMTGTTLAMVVAGENSFTAYNIGDSRIYKVNNGFLVRVSEDHTVEEEMILSGQLSPKREGTTMFAHQLTRFLGMGESYGVPEPDIYALNDYEENRRAVICSDGLSGMLRHKEMSDIMKKAGTVSEAVNALVDAALEKGGNDNVTCIVMEFVK